MREVECDLMEQTITRIKNEFGSLRFLEVGVFTGDTARGVARYSNSIGCPVNAAGVDFVEYTPVPPPECPYVFYDGDSMDQWRRVHGRFNLLFVDGCHCVNHSMTDFLNYSPFVDVGGYCLFHDTALPFGEQKQGEYPQNHGYAGQQPSVLGVREGLVKNGLLQGHRTDWQLITDIESNTGLMGMCLFKKVKEL